MVSVGILCGTAKLFLRPSEHALRGALWVYFVEQRKLFPRPARGMYYGILWSRL